jgi:type I restriction enzyme S subunit
MSWRSIRFEDLYAEPSRNGVYKSKEFHGSGAKMVNMGELFGYEFISNQEMKRVQLTDAELEKSSLKDGDLLFGRRSLVEAGAGKCTLVTDIQEPTAFESSIIRVRLDQARVLPRFLYYWFRSPIGRGRVYAIVSGVNVKGIKGSDLKNIEVELPDLPTQERIAGVLSAYDDLIENNRRRIAVLEQAARLLYREWFVHFRFPGYETAKFVDGLPEGWEVRKVKDLLTRLKSKPKVRKDEYQAYGQWPCVDQGQDFIGGYTDNKETIYHDCLPLIVFGDHTRALKFVDFPFARGADGTQIIQSNEERLPQELFYFSLINVDLSNYAYARHFKFLKDQDIIVPSEELGSTFADRAKAIFDQVRKLRDQNLKLAKARDLLLPRLMDGRLNIS